MLIFENEVNDILVLTHFWRGGGGARGESRSFSSDKVGSSGNELITIFEMLLLARL